MGFSDQQVNALRRALHRAYVRTRKFDGRELSYIEGWHAIAEANRIFGFDHWDRETVESKCVQAREKGGATYALYTAKVRITVRAAGEVIVREGYGTGEGHGSSLGEVHERALKMAETDATKRALATFGKPFGLGLYLSSRNGRAHRQPANELPTAPPMAPISDQDRRRTVQRLGADGRYYVAPRRPIAPALRYNDPPSRSQPVETTGEAKTDGPALDRSIAPPLPRPAGQTITQPVDPIPDRTIDAPPLAPPAAATEKSTVTAMRDPQSIKQAPDDAAKDPPQTIASGVPVLHAPVSRPDLGALLLERPRRRREPAHLKFVMAQPCLICGRTPSDAHHLRHAQPRALARKVSDEFTVPLCRTHHRQAHQSGNEAEWWQAMDRGIDPIQVAKDLWERSHKLRSAKDSDDP